MDSFRRRRPYRWERVTHRLGALLSGWQRFTTWIKDDLPFWALGALILLWAFLPFLLALVAGIAAIHFAVKYW